jgi:hypothetical protein
VSHAEVLATRPHLFANSVVFVSEANLARMARMIAVLEKVVRLPAYRERVLAYAPPVARIIRPEPRASFSVTTSISALTARS